tara:strand:+ start:395 stop:1063 length:669 start_codon:yes stop_codon:yes gene_type:complete
MTRVMTKPLFLPHHPWKPNTTPEIAAKEFYRILSQRRSVRHFSDNPVSLETMQWIVRSAASAPSGANKQPWRFVCVQDPALKKKIRLAAEEEERRFYEERATDSWKEDLAPLGTDTVKEYLETAPWLVVVFKLTIDDDGGGVYYAEESVGIATGMLLAAAQMAGLATLTHTPSPMGFLGDILERPENERAWMLIPMGWPAKECEVPAHSMEKKSLDQVMVVH